MHSREAFARRGAIRRTRELSTGRCTGRGAHTDDDILTLLVAKDQATLQFARTHRRKRGGENSTDFGEPVRRSDEHQHHGKSTVQIGYE